MTRNDVNHPPQQRQRYTMDIRVFLAVIAVAMAISFSIGVAIGPSAPDYASVKDATSVTSVEMVPSQPKSPAGTGIDEHEPAGQVRKSRLLSLSSLSLGHSYSGFASMSLELSNSLSVALVG
jgi:hypothetical protein